MRNVKSFPIRPVQLAGNFVADSTCTTTEVGKGFYAERKAAGHFRINYGVDSAQTDTYNKVLHVTAEVAGDNLASGVYTVVSGVDLTNRYTDVFVRNRADHTLTDFASGRIYFNHLFDDSRST